MIVLNIFPCSLFALVHEDFVHLELGCVKFTIDLIQVVHVQQNILTLRKWVRNKMSRDVLKDIV